jgi:hypothetical protein
MEQSVHDKALRADGFATSAKQDVSMPTLAQDVPISAGQGCGDCKATARMAWHGSGYRM